MTMPSQYKRAMSARVESEPTIDATTIYGVALRDMDDEEIRIAAYWLAIELNRARNGHPAMRKD
jgi:hypothetical protein